MTQLRRVMLIVTFALGILTAPLPADAQQPMYERREFVNAGGLMSYGVNFRDNFRRAAKALGLTIPPSVLLRADQVIQ